MARHNSIRDSLKFLWEQYRVSHLSNLMYSVSLIGAVVVYCQRVDQAKTNETILMQCGMQRALATTFSFAMAAAALAMIHRFTSQYFMEMEVLPDRKAVDQYYRSSNILHKKVTQSYAHGVFVLEVTRYLHNLSKIFSPLFLYTSLYVFINHVILRSHPTIALTPSNNDRFYYWYVVSILLMLGFSAVYMVMRKKNMKNL